APARLRCSGLLSPDDQLPPGARGRASPSAGTRERAWLRAWFWACAPKGPIEASLRARSRTERGPQWRRRPPRTQIARPDRCCWGGAPDRPPRGGAGAGHRLKIQIENFDRRAWRDAPRQAYLLRRSRRRGNWALPPPS